MNVASKPQRSLLFYEIVPILQVYACIICLLHISAAGNVTVSTTSIDHPNINSSVISASKSVNRYYSLTNSDIVFKNYNAIFYFTAADVDGGSNTANFNVENYRGSSWLVPATSLPSSYK